jgi:hypothetical protein
MTLPQDIIGIDIVWGWIAAFVASPGTPTPSRPTAPA